jgi:hypothetical protein
MYSGDQYDACDVTLSTQYIHTGQARKICLQPRWELNLRSLEYWALAGHWASIPKVVYRFNSHRGRHIFRACPVRMYTQSNITSKSMFGICGIITFILYY